MALKGSLTTNYWTNDAGKTRGYVLEWSATQSVSDNESIIAWVVKTAGTYPYGVAERTLKASLGGKSLVNKTDRVMRDAGTVASGSFTLKHDSNGELNISGSIEVAVYVSSVNCIASDSWDLDKIARQAVISSISDFTDEDNPVIEYSNPEGNGATSLQACISLDGENDDIPYREIDLSGTSYTFELTDEERELLRTSTVGSDSLTVYFILKTTMESITLDDKVEKVFAVINAMPTLNPTIVDINGTTIALTGNPSILVKEHSNAQVISGAEVYKGAGIKSEKIICGNQSLTGSGTIENVGSGAFVFSLTDTRENTVTQETKVPLIEYVNLTCNLVAHAPDAEGDMNFIVSGNCFSGTFGVADNEVLIYYRYKDNASDFTEWFNVGNAVLGNNTYSLDVHLDKLDYRKKYTFQAKAVDKLMSVASVERVVKTIPVFDWGEEDFNFNVPVRIKGVSLVDLMYPVGKIYMSVDDTNPELLFEGTKWEVWGTGRVPVGVDISDEEFEEVEKTGGEKEHLLTVDEIPAHKHSVYNYNAGGNVTVTDGYAIDFRTERPFKTYGALLNMNETGGNEVHNNMQPYITCYMWKRVA